MKYVAIDIETTGLDRVNGQILEFAAVFADLEDNTTPVSDLPMFHTYVTHPEYKVEPYAAWMNATAFERIGKQLAGWHYTPIDRLAQSFHTWIRDMGGGVVRNELCLSEIQASDRGQKLLGVRCTLRRADTRVGRPFQAIPQSH